MVLSILFWTAVGLLVLHYALYPALLALFSSFARPSTPAAEGFRPGVSVLISARNEEKHIGARIENLLTQDYAGSVEILVGSDASTDATEEIVRGYESRGVRLLVAEKRAGKPRMLQALRKLASGEILVFTDADTVFAPHTISSLVRPFSDHRTGCVDGVRLNSLDRSTCESTYMKYERWIKSMCSRLGTVLGGTGAVFALRADAFMPLTEDRADDFELAVMARVLGYRCVYEREAVAMEPTPDDRAQYRRMVRIVSWMSGSGARLIVRAARAGRPGLVLQLLVHKILRWLSGFFLSGATLCSGLLALGDAPLYGSVFILLMAFHMAALLGMLTGNRLPGPLKFPFYFWLMNAASMVGIVRMATGNPVETWDRSPKPGRAEAAR
jgi:cellulose synthase/poly-beta-1,6-N-acetylglucosamine synthase-like glycosyltransferase